MEKNRFVFITILSVTIFGVLMIQGIKCQTIFRLNVDQPSELIVDAGSEVSIDVGNNTIIGGSPTASGGTGSMTYVWSYPEYLNNGTIANPTAQPPGNVTFRVTVTDERGCAASDEILVIVVGGTYLGETKEGVFRIYPNPTSGTFTIQMEEIESPEIRIALINMSGQVIYQDIIESAGTSFSTEVSLHGLSKGVYFLRIYGDFESFYRQIILK